MNNRESGSISILAAVISMSILFLSLGIIQYSKIYNEQVSLDRRIDLLGDYILSEYDRDLYRRYGLFGFESGNNYSSFYNENYSELDNSTVFMIQNLTSLYSNSEMKRQILNFTRGRIPTLILSEIEERSNAITDLISRLPSTPEIGGLTDGFFNDIRSIFGSNYSPGSLSMWLDTDENASGEIFLSNSSSMGSLYLENQTLDNTYSTDEDNSEEIDTSELDEFNEDLSKLDDISNQLNFDETLIIDESKYGNNVFSPFMQLIDQANNLIRNNEIMFIDGLIFNEYVLNQFSSRLRNSETDFESLAGINFNDLSFSSVYEAEEIIIGNSDSRFANNAVQVSIFSIRLLTNVIANYNNSSLMSLYRTTGSIISLLIALITVGHVQVEAEAIASALLIIDSAIDSWSDLQSINEGESLVFYDDNSDKFYTEIELNYYDYLRLIALLVPIENQLDQVGRILNINLNKHYFVDAIIYFNYKNVYWEQTAMRTFAYE